MRRTFHRRRRAQGGCLSFAIGLLAVAALALAAALFITNRIQVHKPVETPPQTEAPQQSVAPGSTAFELDMVLTADSFQGQGEPIPVLTPSPTPSAEPTPSPEPTFNPDEPFALVRPQPIEEGFLPVFKKANTEERRIAITVDECTGAPITSEFAKMAYKYGAKLTLFPSGENCMLKGMGDVLKVCLYQMGFEIENRGFNAMSKYYQMNDAMMAADIWKQEIALSYVLGVRYHPHFLRLYGGDGANDGRTHAYLRQEGYLGIADWTFNGGTMAEGRIGSNLAPGNIYYFKSTSNDLHMMELLMDEAKGQGYEMVTLNALFGYEENAYEDGVNVLAEEMPELKNPDVPYYFMKTGDCTWATNLLQRRLIELGYLSEGNADGVFGSGTAAALSAFQAKLNLAATGAADVITQEKIYDKNAPRVDE